MVIVHFSCFMALLQYFHCCLRKFHIQYEAIIFVQVYNIQVDGTPWPCGRMVRIHTCLRSHYVCTLYVSPYRVLHNYRAEYLMNELSSTRRTRLTTSFTAFGVCKKKTCPPPPPSPSLWGFGQLAHWIHEL